MCDLFIDVIENTNKANPDGSLERPTVEAIRDMPVISTLHFDTSNPEQFQTNIMNSMVPPDVFSAFVYYHVQQYVEEPLICSPEMTMFFRFRMEHNHR